MSDVDDSNAAAALLRVIDRRPGGLGPREAWPRALRVAADIVIASPVPMVLLWGVDGVMIYNDAYAVIAGARHPALFGARVREGWPEAASFHDDVLRTVLNGGTLALRRQEFVLNRDGTPATAWFDLDYSPVPGDDSRPGGVLAIVSERTEQVEAERLRAEAEALLRAERDRARGVLDNMGEAFVLMDRDFRLVDMNAEAARLDPRPPEAVLGLTHWEAHPNAAPELTDLYRAAMAERRPVSIEHRYVWPDGRVSWIEMRANPVGGDDGGLAVFYRDTTARHEAEERLRETERRLTAVLDNASVAVFLMDDRQHCAYMNAAAERLTGFTLAETQGRPLHDVIHHTRPDGTPFPLHECAIDRAFPENADTRGEEVFVHKDGSFYPVSFVASPIRDEASRTVGTIIEVRDVSADCAIRAALEEARVAAEAEAAERAAILGQLAEGVIVADREGRIAFVNDAAHRLHGVARLDVEPEDYADAYHLMTEAGEPYPSEDLPLARAVLKAETVTDARWRIRRPDGTEVLAVGSARPVIGPDSAQAGAVLTLRDDTARVAAETALRLLNEELEARVARATQERDRLWRNTQDMQVVIDRDGTFLAVSPAATAILGWTPEEMVGRTVFDLVLPEDQGPTDGALEHARGDALPTFENRYRHKNGGFRWLSWVAAPEGDSIYASGRHVTAEKEREAALEAAEAALRQSQKMEAVGQLTGGIAHDFNNMLAAVIGSLDLLSRRIGDDARSRRYVEAAMDGAKRAALLTQRLLAFSRQQPLRPEDVDVNRLVAGMSDLLRHSLGGMVQLETVLAGGLWRAHADPNQIESVILNLAVNARDAMEGGGHLTIETANAHLDSHYADAHLGVPAGQYVMVAVSDTGHGMDASVIARAFDPFFTTKPVGRGTGLGLSQVYGFVRQSGGHVKIYSEPGQGTSVKIYLPRLVEPAQAAGAAPAPAGSPAADLPDLPAGTASEVILVVEDEAMVRRVSVDTLLELGYHVLEAEHGAAALRLLETHPEVVLLFTDIVMPEMDGRRLSDEARRLRPGLRVLYTSGYTRNAVVHNGIVDPGVHLIGKPFTIEDLAAKVRDVLDGPAT